MIFRDRITLLILALAVTCSGFAASAATLELTGPAGASCRINDQDLGVFPLSDPLTLEAGAYVITATLPGFFPFERTILIESENDWLRVRAGLLPLKKSTAWKSNLLYAGLGQFYMGKKTKGWVFALLETGGLLTALAGEAQRLNYRNDYLILKNKYDSSVNAVEIENYRRNTGTAYSNMEDMESLRNTGLMVAGGAIVFSILDALFLFPSAEMGPGTTPLQTSFNAQNAPSNSDFFTSFHAGIRVAF